MSAARERSPCYAYSRSFALTGAAKRPLQAAESPRQYRHNFLYIVASRRASIKPTSATKSSTRNGLRPVASATNGSRSAASVHARGNERCTPSSSKKNTRSSPHVRRATTNTNSRSRHGWNGCVTRTVRCAAAQSGAVAGERERRRRDVLRHPQEAARQPPQLAVAARAAVSRVRVHRGVLQPRAPPLHPRHALPSHLRTTTTLAAGWLRPIARTTTININNHNPRCHANRGRSILRLLPAPKLSSAPGP